MIYSFPHLFSHSLFVTILMINWRKSGMLKQDTHLPYTYSITANNMTASINHFGIWTEIQVRRWWKRQPVIQTGDTVCIKTLHSKNQKRTRGCVKYSDNISQCSGLCVGQSLPSNLTFCWQCSIQQSIKIKGKIKFRQV